VLVQKEFGSKCKRKVIQLHGYIYERSAYLFTEINSFKETNCLSFIVYLLMRQRF